MANKNQVKASVPKVIKSEAPKSKPTDQPAVDNKQIKEIVLLGLILVVVFVLAYFAFIRKNEDVKEQPSIPTQFEIQELDTVRKRDNTYPEVITDDIGKPNPFAQ